MYTFVTPHFCASVAHLGTWMGKKPNLGLPQNVSHWVYHTYVQQVRNCEGIQKKKLHVGTRHRIEFTLKLNLKPTRKKERQKKKNNQNILTPQCVVATTWENRTYAFNLAKKMNNVTFGIIVAGRIRDGRRGGRGQQRSTPTDLTGGSTVHFCQKTISCSSWVQEVNRNWKTYP